MSADLTTKFFTATYANPLMNASGVYCMTTEELVELDNNSQAGSFITKTATPQHRDGNPEPRYQSVPLGSINSMGLPNNGFDYYLDYVLNRQRESPNAKPIFFSLTGMTTQESLDMLQKLQDSEFSGFTELNLSCPNVPGKPQVAYDFELTEKILTQVFTFFKKPLGIKLPPFFDFAHFDMMANILNKFPLSYVNCINSIGNGLYIDVDSETVVVKPKGGFGGIGGDYAKPTALANVRAFYLRLNPSIKIIGTGGIRTGQDAFEHLLCGATMLQIGTQLCKEGPSCFERIANELKDVMQKKGYKTIEEFQGKLKSIE